MPEESKTTNEADRLFNGADATDHATESEEQASAVQVSPDNQLRIRDAANAGCPVGDVKQALSTLRAVISEAEGRPTCASDVVQVAALRAVVGDLDTVEKKMRAARRRRAELFSELEFIHDATELPF